MKMLSTVRLILLFVFLKTVTSAPTRQSKNLAYLDYLQPDNDYSGYDIDNDDYVSMALEDNALSRTIPSRKTRKPFNSPIYYIRLPPQPYMFVPGLGYVSQPPPPAVSQFVNVRMPFVVNGKPSNIYQWSSNFQGFPTEAPPSQDTFQSFPSQNVLGDAFSTQTPSSGIFSGFGGSQNSVKKPTGDSEIHRLPGKFNFNGKPKDIIFLRDSYNSLLNDVLQNVYP